jgi:hypothetical protein
MTTSTGFAAPPAELADFFARWRIVGRPPFAQPPCVAPGELRAFVAAWAARTDAGVADEPANANKPLAERLRGFLAACSPLQLRLAASISAPAPESTLDWTERLPDFARLIDVLRPALDAQARLHRAGGRINVWAASDLGRDEMRNSKVLAWLLDRWGSHGQGAELLGALLDRVDMGCEGFPGSKTTDQPYWTSVESCPLGEQDSRIDIEIDGPGLLLFVEVKIDAPETAGQLDRYFALAEAKARGRPWGVIYLTRHGRLPAGCAPGAARGRLASLSWRGLADVVCRYAETLPDCFARTVLRQYAERIRTL